MKVKSITIAALITLALITQTQPLEARTWYILPDEFLVSAEATVRNLIIGHKVASRLGRVQKVGYMPDSFGHIAQMPQVLKLARIDSFVYSRGNGDEIERTGHEFFWRAPDGSQVLAVNQCKGYDNAAGLGLASYWEAHTQRDIDINTFEVVGCGTLDAQLSCGLAPHTRQ